MRKSLLVSVVLFLVITAKAQNGFVFNCAQDVVLTCAQSCVTLKANVPDIRSSTADYAVNSISAGGCFRPPVPPDLPGNSTNLEDDDTYTPEIPLPFDFPFYGIIYASLIASTNGIICFDVAEAENFSHYAMLSSGAGLSATGTGGGVDLPDTRYDRALIMGIYEDINPFYPTSPYKQIKYDVIGTAPHRKWILSFYKIPTYSAACQNQIENTYQITLFEGLGLVEVHVFGREKCTGWNQGRAMIGMQNYDRDKGIMPPGRAASTNPLWGSTVMNEAWRFIPNDGPTLFKRVELLDINGNIVATGSTENIGNNTLEASFPNICPPGVGTTSYIVRSVYSKFDDPGVEVYGMDTINVTKNAVASPIQETIVPAVCGTNPTGTITITSPVGPDYIYSIDGGTDFQSSPVFTVAPGSYTIIATDNSSGCSSTKDVIVTSPSTLTATAVSTNTSCPEAANGTITVTATQGTPGYTYALDSTTTYGASNIFTGVTAGPHTVFVTDNAGCVFSFSQDVNSDVSFTTTAVSSDASCVGVANGIITVSQPALGVPPFQYSVTGLIALQNSPVLSGLKGDTSYNIRVVDANGCSYSFDQAVANGNGVNATFVSINSACAGVNTGQIVITPTAGTGPFTYSIDGGTTYPALDTIRNLASGSYSIKVKDDVGCIYDAPAVTVGDDPGVNATFVSINSACLGVSTGQIVITPTAGTGPFTYSIDGGTTYPALDTIRNLASGSYSIKVKDDVGCIYDAPAVTVGDDPGVNATFVSINSACLGVSTGQIVITPTAGTGPFTYSIDGGTTYPALDTIRNLASGSYSIKVKDDVGCVYDAPAVTVGDDPGVNATFVSINSACLGVSTGQIVITPTAGTGPFTYSIDGGTTYPSLDTIRNLASGSYSIKVKDDVGCIYDAPAVTVGDDPGVNATFVSINSACLGVSTGQIVITPTAGTGPFTYSIDGGTTYPALDTIRNLASGSYNIKVKDDVGCIYDAPPVTVNDGIGVTATFTTINSACAAANTGQIVITPTAGTGPFTYSIDGGTTYPALDTIRNLASGSYSIKVKDDVGCVYDAPAVTVGDDPGVNATFVSINSACSGVSTGQIVITPTAGTAPFTYSIDGGSTYPALDTIRNLASGSYSIKVKDDVGCVYDAPAVTVGDDPGVNATFVSINSACPGVSTGQIVITPTAGTGPFTYSIDGGTTYPALDTIRNLASGSYSIKVKDNVGCVYDAPPVTVNDGIGVTATFTTINSACAAASTGQIVIKPTTGIAPFSYSVDGGTNYTTLDTIRGLGEGSYSIKVKDVLGCVYDAPPVIVNSNSPGVGASFSTVNSACSGVSTGKIIITPTIGIAPFRYSADGGVTYPVLDTIRNLASGTYNLKVRDALGCTYDAPPVTVGNDVGVTASFATVNSACAAASTGQIVITPATGISPFGYSTDGGATYKPLDTLRNLTEGNYSIKVRDAVGCVYDEPAVLVKSNNPGLSASFATENAACSGVSSGKIIITPTSGQAPFNYSIDGGVTYPALDTIRNLSAGNYTVKVRDALGCSFDSPSITVNNNIGVTASYTLVKSACAGVATGAIIVTPATGTPGFEYSMDAGITYQSDSVFRNLAANNYTIRVRDAQGCILNSPVQEITNGPGVLTDAPTIQNASCATIPNGSITVNVTAGIAPFYFTNISLAGSTQQPGNLFSGLFSGSYDIAITDSAGCSKTITAVVGNNPKIRIDSLNIVRPSCNGLLNGTITVNASLGVSPYEFAIDAGSYSSSKLFTAVGAGTHTLYIKDANNCQIDSVITITEPAVLNNVLVGTTRSTCSGNPDGQLVVNGNGGTPPYQYTLDAAGTSGLQSSGSFPVMAGSYMVTVKDVNACTATVNAVVDSVFSMFLDLGNDVTICAGETTVLDPNTNSETNIYSYTPAASLDNAAIKKPGAAPAETTTYRLTATWGICTLTDSITVNVLRKPVPDAGFDAVICHDTTVTLEARASNLSGTVNYLWAPASLVEGKADSTVVTARPINEKTYYTVTVTDNYGCNFSVTDSVLVTMLPPVYAFAGNDTNAVLGVPHQLNATGAGIGGTYEWSYPSGVTLTNSFLASSTAIFSPVAQPGTFHPETNYYLLSVVATNQAGCKAVDSVKINVFEGPAYYVPTAFTPNGDGVNDVFRPVPVGVTSPEYFRVFNRYGQVVFETSRFMQGWDGKFKGLQQPNGNYVWILKGKDSRGKSIEMKGSILLIR